MTTRRTALLGALAIVAFGATSMIVVLLMTRSGAQESSSGESVAVADPGAPARIDQRPVFNWSATPAPAQPPSGGAASPTRRSFVVDVPPMAEHDERVEAVAPLTDHDERLDALISVRQRRLVRSMEGLNRRVAQSQR